MISVSRTLTISTIYAWRLWSQVFERVREVRVSVCGSVKSVCHQLRVYVCVSILLLRVVYLRQCQLVTELIKHTRAQLLAAIYLYHTPLAYKYAHALLVMAQLHLQLKVKHTFLCFFGQACILIYGYATFCANFPIFFHIFRVSTWVELRGEASSNCWAK